MVSVRCDDRRNTAVHPLGDLEWVEREAQLAQPVSEHGVDEPSARLGPARPPRPQIDRPRRRRLVERRNLWRHDGNIDRWGQRGKRWQQPLRRGIDNARTVTCRVRLDPSVTDAARVAHGTIEPSLTAGQVDPAPGGDDPPLSDAVDRCPTKLDPLHAHPQPDRS
jgi:hypothetical protein